ncbi:kinase-like domain-containing protein [Rhizophagus clarus]|uniref:Kinase-like domain-containing protein n=1 Tax=Rhizophagus clarus TaxID=94130 RepID=A0A8H3M9K0_9GLOM|nr:kinase-like domain-containing protein [Rhizophagus clarus]
MRGYVFILPFSDAIHQMKKHILVLEYADSDTLNSYLKENFNKFDWTIRYELEQQLASTVACIHEEKIIHHDLIAEASSNARIFGSIPYVDSKSFNNNPDDNSKYKSYKLSKKSDVYSIGVLMWQISSGYKLFYNKGSEYDLTLALAIVNGKREKIIDGTPTKYCNLYEAGILASSSS